MKRRIALCLFATLAMAALPDLANAQGTFPSKPVKFIVPFPAGGINDVLARIAADKLQAKWGQPIIIEQKTGAGGNIGADLAAQAEPDGHTLFVARARAARHQRQPLQEAVLQARGLRA